MGAGAPSNSTGGLVGGVVGVGLVLSPNVSTGLRTTLTFLTKVGPLVGPLGFSAGLTKSVLLLLFCVCVDGSLGLIRVDSNGFTINGARFSGLFIWFSAGLYTDSDLAGTDTGLVAFGGIAGTTGGELGTGVGGWGGLVGG